MPRLTTDAKISIQHFSYGKRRHEGRYDTPLYTGSPHQRYLREHRPIIYSDLVLSGKLYGYLSDIDTQARNKLDLLVTQLAEKEGIDEHLKAHDQLAWIKAMESIRIRVEEIINEEILFA